MTKKSPFICEQDHEDAEQERLINEWLLKNKPDAAEHFKYKHLTRTGGARNTLVRSAFSLDQDIRKDEPGSCTYADLVTGFDGRSLEDGSSDYHFEVYFQGVVRETLSALGLNEGEIEWLIGIWLRSETLDDLHSQISTIDLEWESL